MPRRKTPDWHDAHAMPSTLKWTPTLHDRSIAIHPPSPPTRSSNSLIAASTAAWALPPTVHTLTHYPCRRHNYRKNKSVQLHHFMRHRVLHSILEQLNGSMKEPNMSIYFFFSAHHSVVFYCQCSVYWWKGSVRF